MGCRLTTLSLLLHILLMMCVHGRGARVMLGSHLKEEMRAHIDDPNRETDRLRLHSMDGDERDEHLWIYKKQIGDDTHGGVHDHANAQSSHMHHMMESALNVFIMEKNLRVGNSMPIYFPHRDPSSSAHFLPREEANSIPFSSSQLPYLLQRFSFSNGSPQAKAMEDTLRQCEVEPIRGETKFCATSLESMIDFASSIFGVNIQFKVLTTIYHRESKPDTQTPFLQNYTIVDIPMEILPPQMAACHTMPYPYAVLYCHYLESGSKVLKVSLISQYGQKLEAVVVCHMDTSAWSPEHFSFHVLGIKPGTVPVCHFFPDDHLVWVPSPSLT